MINTEYLNLEDVARHMESKGYKVQNLEQIWRHVTGLIKFENEKLFLKMASTKEIGVRTMNEKCFNENANTIWKKYLNFFKVPKIFDEGVYNGNYWFVSEYIFGKQMSGDSPKRREMTDKDLRQASLMAKNILDLTDYCLLPKDKEHLKHLWADRIQNISKLWSKEVKYNTNNLLRFIEERRNDIEVSMSHGDFTPWHIMNTKKDEYFLVDSEASQSGGLRHYDAAYFYHRVYTNLKQPEIAESFLEKYKDVLSWTEKDELAFAPVLASRIMGGFFEAEGDGIATNFELNQELENKLLTTYKTPR